MKPLYRYHDRWFGIVVLASLLISAFLFWNTYCISPDGVDYVDAAKSLYAGDLKAALSSVYPPGYPALIALFHSFVRDWEWAGQLVSVLAGVFLLFPLYGLLNKIYGKPAAVVGCLLAAVNPFLARYAVHVRTESLFFFLAVFSLYIFHGGMERRKTADFFFGGVVAGFAFLVRPEALGFVIIVPGVVLFLWWVKKCWSFMWAAQASAALLVGFALFAIPYVVYLSAETGEWGAVSRKAGITLRVGLSDAGLLDADIAREFPTGKSMSVPEFIKKHPWVYVKKVLSDMVSSVGVYFEALHYPYVPFLLLGLIAAFRERPWERKDFFLLVYLIFFMLGFAAIYVNRRYSVQLVAVSMGWTALGILWSWNWLKTKLSEGAARTAVALLGLALLAGTLPKTLKPIAQEKVYLKEAGWYIRQRHGPQPLNIMLFEDRISFYADAKAVPLRHLSEAEVLALLRNRRGDFLAVDSRTLQRRFPALIHSAEQYGLPFEKEFVGPERDRLVVYKLS